METKKWYQSKIFILGILLVFTGLSDAFTHWITGSVTVDQIQVVQTAYPELYKGISDAIATKNYAGVILAIVGFLNLIWRGWFTTGALFVKSGTAARSNLAG